VETVYDTFISMNNKIQKKLELFLSRNTPVNTKRWRWLIGQAKGVFNTYPSPEATAWVVRKYTSAGGGWKKVTVEELDPPILNIGDEWRDYIRSNTGYDEPNYLDTEYYTGM